MLNKSLSNACLSNARGESFLFDMIYAGLVVSHSDTGRFATVLLFATGVDEAGVVVWLLTIPIRKPRNTNRHTARSETTRITSEFYFMWSP
jgi:hypothetical protein